MKYLRFKLSKGKWGTGPTAAIRDAGGVVNTSWYVADDGYRIGYLWSGNIDLTALAPGWAVTELTGAEALTFAQTIWPDAEMAADGRITEPPPGPE